MNGNERLRADEMLIASLAAGYSIVDSARRSGMGESTARRRLRSPMFRQRVAEARTEVLSQALGLLTDSATYAVAALRTLLVSHDPKVKLGAARAILEHVVRLGDAVDVRTRLDALERRGGGAHDGQVA